MFRVEAAFNGRAMELQIVLIPGERLPFGNANLLGDEIGPEGHLGNRMLHLQTRVHLDEVELVFLVYQEFHGARIGILHRRRHREGCLYHVIA
jgi:hypothetical protein